MILNYLHFFIHVCGYIDDVISVNISYSILNLTELRALAPEHLFCLCMDPTGGKAPQPSETSTIPRSTMISPAKLNSWVHHAVIERTYYFRM